MKEGIKLDINMKIFLSYIHDTNAPLIEKIKEYLSKDVEGNLMMSLKMASCKTIDRAI